MGLTGSTDITTAGTASLVSKPLPAEKFIVIVRHGLTTWNQSKQIQVSICRLYTFVPAVIIPKGYHHPLSDGRLLLITAFRSEQRLPQLAPVLSLKLCKQKGFSGAYDSAKDWNRAANGFCAHDVAFIRSRYLKHDC